MTRQPRETPRLAGATRSPAGSFSASALAVGLVFLLARPGLVAATDAGVADDVGAPAPSGESADAGADPNGALPGGVQPPRLVATVKATYPEAAAAAGREAVVPLVLTVGIDGAVTAVEVESPVGHGFDEAATAAAWQYRFEPARVDGRPMAARIRHRYAFELGAAPAAPALGAADAGSPVDSSPASGPDGAIQAMGLSTGPAAPGATLGSWPLLAVRLWRSLRKRRYHQILTRWFAQLEALRSANSAAGRAPRLALG